MGTPVQARALAAWSNLDHVETSLLPAAMCLPRAQGLSSLSAQWQSLCVWRSAALSLGASPVHPLPGMDAR